MQTEPWPNVIKNFYPYTDPEKEYERPVEIKHTFNNGMQKRSRGFLERFNCFNSLVSIRLSHIERYIEKQDTWIVGEDQRFFASDFEHSKVFLDHEKIIVSIELKGKETIDLLFLPLHEIGPIQGEKNEIRKNGFLGLPHQAGLHHFW